MQAITETCIQKFINSLSTNIQLIKNTQKDLAQLSNDNLQLSNFIEKINLYSSDLIEEYQNLIKAASIIPNNKIHEVEKLKNTMGNIIDVFIEKIFIIINSNLKLNSVLYKELTTRISSFKKQYTNDSLNKYSKLINKIANNKLIKNNEKFDIFNFILLIVASGERKINLVAQLKLVRILHD